MNICYSTETLFLDLKINYQQPDLKSWILSEFTYNPITEKGNLIYKHRGLVNENGETINPAITVYYEKLHSDSVNIIAYSFFVRQNLNPHKILNTYIPEHGKIKHGLAYEVEMYSADRIFYSIIK